MSTMIFVNLPVADLQRSVDFWSALGYSFNPQFTDENATSLIIDDGHIYAMLLTHDYFTTFTKKEIADSSSAEVIIALSADSREAVDELADKALANGGSAANDPQELGFMYGAASSTQTVTSGRSPGWTRLRCRRRLTPDA